MRKAQSLMDIILEKDFKNLLFCHPVDTQLVKFVLSNFPSLNLYPSGVNVKELRIIEDYNLLNQGFFILDCRGEVLAHHPWWLSNDRREQIFRWGMSILERTDKEIAEKLATSVEFNNRLKLIKKYAGKEGLTYDKREIIAKEFWAKQKKEKKLKTTTQLDNIIISSLTKSIPKATERGRQK